MIAVQVWHWILEMDQYLWPFVALKRHPKSGCGVELWRGFSKLSHRHMIAISDSEDEASAWGPKAPQAKRQKQGVASAKTESSAGKDCNPWGLPGLPCEICDELIPSSEFLKHWKQHTLIPCECGESLDPKDFAEHMKKHERPKLPSETPELIPCEICGDFFLPSEYTEHWKGHEAKTLMSDLSNYTTPSAMAARWVEHLRCEAETQNLPPSCIIVNFDLAVSFAERALRETWDGKDVWIVFLQKWHLDLGYKLLTNAYWLVLLV